MIRAVLLALAAVPLFACAAAPFDESGFKHPTHLITVRYQDAAAHVLISKDRRVDNYVLDRNGARIHAKEGDDYEWLRKVDFNGDGTEETKKSQRFELN